MQQHQNRYLSDDLIVALGAIAGTLARFGRWFRDDHSFDWQKAVGELLSVPAIVFIVSGGIVYVAPEMDVRAVAAISACVGLIGVASLESLILPYAKKRLGL